MKKNSFLGALKPMWLVLIALTIVVSSCKKDDPVDPTPDPEIVLDGIYVTGAGTALVDLNEKGLMKSTKNEVDQSDRAALL